MAVATLLVELGPFPDPGVGVSETPVAFRSEVGPALSLDRSSESVSCDGPRVGSHSWRMHDHRVDVQELLGGTPPWSEPDWVDAEGGCVALAWVRSQLWVSDPGNI